MTRYQLLGPVGVTRPDGRVTTCAGRRLRIVAAMLLLHANEPVPAARLIDALWGDDAPVHAGSALRAVITQFRRMVEPQRRRGDPSVLTNQSSGWVLSVPDDALDAVRFESLVSRSRQALAAGDDPGAAAIGRAALALWRGPALADVVDELPAARAAARRWEELRLETAEQTIELELRRGRHQGLVSELAALVEAHPLRERLVSLLMLAHHRRGQQVEALRVYERARCLLRDEMGIRPTAELVALERSILLQEPVGDLPGRSTTPVRPPVPIIRDGGTLQRAAPADAGAVSPPVPWERTVDALELALHRETDAMFAVYRQQHADAVPIDVWWLKVWDATVLTARGEMELAEAAVHGALTLGQESDFPEAWPTFCGQIFILRWLARRLPELAGLMLVERSGDLAELPIWAAAHALALVEVGEDDAAMATVDQCIDRVLSLPRADDFRVAALALLADAVAQLGRRAVHHAERLLVPMLPLEGWQLVVSPGLALLGPADRLVGGLHAVCGRQLEATRSLERAAVMADAAGLRPFAARARQALEAPVPDRCGVVAVSG